MIRGRIRLLGALMALMVVACNAGVTDPTMTPLKEGSRITADVMLTPMFIDRRTNAVRTGPVTRTTLSAIIHNGRASLASQGRGPLTSTLADVPSTDAIVGTLLGSLGFTSASASNPNYASPVGGGAKTDTLIVVDSTDVEWGVMISSGTYGEVTNRVYSRSSATFLTENRQWNSVSGGITLSRVILNDYSDPNVVIRTNIDITRTRVIELTLLEKIWGKAKALASAAFGIVTPEPAYAISWECFRDAMYAAASFATFVAASAGVVAAGAGTVGTGGAAAPSVPLALTGYFVATAWLTGTTVDAARSCFGSGGGGQKVKTGKT